jgi:hypothetical protein
MNAADEDGIGSRDTDARITVHPDTSTEQCDIADLFGKVQIDADYDYKSLRQAASGPPDPAARLAGC